MNIQRLFLLLFITFGLQFSFAQKANSDQEKINKILDDLNEYAAKAEYQLYFNLFDQESTYIGTDATEIWSKNDFMVWAKPFFEKKSTWNFKSVKRNIHFIKGSQIAYFDELLDTQMKICRGSGVLEKIKGEWKIKQYVLSMTIPNEVTKKVVAEKSDIETELLNKL